MSDVSAVKALVFDVFGTVRRLAHQPDRGFYKMVADARHQG